MKCKEMQEREKINLSLQNKKKQNLKEKGITLIALVVTIIILLILVGVTLNMAMSESGLFSRARQATDDYNQKSIEEKLQLIYAEKIMDDNDSSSSVKSDVTSLLEEMTEGKEITQKDIEEFNKLLEPYNEEIKSVNSVDELEKIGQDEEHPIDGVYVQLSDIDEITTQMGTEENPFTGVYNGNGKSVKKLTITADSDSTGMFGLNEGTIKNVTIENCEIISEKGRVGGIAGKNSGLIENCVISKGNVKSNGQYVNEEGKEDGSRIGGICGENSSGGLIRNCKNYTNVEGIFKLVGGICGWNVRR